MKKQKNSLKFNWPRIESEEIKAVNKQLKKSISIYNRSGIIEELEKNIERYFGMKHAVLMNSGTSSLHSIYMSLGLTDKDEVICPAYTFFATVTPLLFTGAIPVLVDCDKNGNIDPLKIEEKITPRTKAIMVTHMWGMPCQMNKIIKIAKKHKLLLLEDASHAHGAKYNNKLIGTFGDISAFSMQGQKTLTGGEGGFIITNNNELYYKSLLIGHYNKRCKTEIPKDNELYKYTITGMGLKFRIHPLAAAIANEQLKKLKQVILGRNKFAKYLINNLKGVKGIRVPIVSKDIVPSWYAFVIKFIPEELNNVTVDDFLEYLIKNGCVDADIPGSTCPLNLLPLFQDPTLLFPKYKNRIYYKKGDFPNAEYFYNHIIKMPIWDKKDDLYIAKYYVKIIKKFLEDNKK